MHSDAVVNMHSDRARPCSALQAQPTLTWSACFHTTRVCSSAASLILPCVTPSLLHAAFSIDLNMPLTLTSPGWHVDGGLIVHCLPARLDCLDLQLSTRLKTDVAECRARSNGFTSYTAGHIQYPAGRVKAFKDVSVSTSFQLSLGRLPLQITSSDTERMMQLLA